MKLDGTEPCSSDQLNSWHRNGEMTPTHFFSSHVSTLSDLSRVCAILLVSYVWKIKFARRVRRYSELFLNLLRINKVSEKQRRLLEVVNFRQQLRRCLLSIVDNRSRPSSINVRVASKVWQHLSVPAIVSCVDAADRHWSDSFVSATSVCCLRQSNGTSSFRLSSLVYHGRPVF